MWRGDNDSAESDVYPPTPPPPSSNLDPLGASRQGPGHAHSPPYRSTLNIPGTYSRSTLMSNSFRPGRSSLQSLKGLMFWSFFWLLVWARLATSGGRLVLRDILGVPLTDRIVDDRLLVLALLLGSAILCVPLSMGVAALSYGPNNASFVVLCSYFASTVVLPVGTLALRSFAGSRVTLTAMQALGMGVAGWLMCSFAVVIFVMLLSVVSVCFVHEDSSRLF